MSAGKSPTTVEAIGGQRRDGFGKSIMPSSDMVTPLGVEAMRWRRSVTCMGRIAEWLDGGHGGEARRHQWHNGG